MENHGGKKIGYFPGKGFAPRISTKEDLKNEKLVAKHLEVSGEPLQVGEIVRAIMHGEKSYWKTPVDVFKNYSIPTTYSKRNTPE